MDKDAILLKAFQNENELLKENINDYKKNVINLEKKIEASNKIECELKESIEYYKNVIEKINEEKENINQKLESILNSRSYIYIQKIKNVFKKNNGGM